MAIDILKFTDLQGNLHHYNLDKVEDMVKHKETGKNYVLVDDEAKSSYEISDEEFNRLTGNVDAPKTATEAAEKAATTEEPTNG